MRIMAYRAFLLTAIPRIMPITYGLAVLALLICLGMAQTAEASIALCTSLEIGLCSDFYQEPQTEIDIVITSPLPIADGPIFTIANDYTPHYEFSNGGADLSVWGDTIIINGGSGVDDPLSFLLYGEAADDFVELSLAWDYFLNFHAPTLSIYGGNSIQINGEVHLPEGVGPIVLPGDTRNRLQARRERAEGSKDHVIPAQRLQPLEIAHQLSEFHPGSERLRQVRILLGQAARTNKAGHRACDED